MSPARWPVSSCWRWRGDLPQRPVVLTLLVRLLGPFIAKGPPQSQATTPITATTQPPGRPSGNSLDVGLPAHETTPVRPRTPGPATRTP